MADPLASPRRHKYQRRVSLGSFKDLQGATGPEHRVNEANNHRGDQEPSEIPKATMDIKANRAIKPL